MMAKQRDNIFANKNLFASSGDSMTNVSGRKVDDVSYVYSFKVGLWREQVLDWTGLITRNYIGRHGRPHTHSKSQRLCT